jgi:cation diffusion facilitator CzcD-associated flavoprotein CzcO
MAQTADHVTMLQRSPSYVVSMPARDKLADWLRARLPAKLAYALVRWRNVAVTMTFYKLARSRPAQFKARVIGMVQKALGPTYDVATHFTPRYDPWDQRLCLVPDDDLFRSLKKGKAEMVTDTIETFTETGLRLSSGRELAADVVVAATGLKLKLLGGVKLEVDGALVDLAKTMTYKGMMYSGVPNLASAIGYTNASWTLKCDLTCAYICRLLAYMDRKGFVACTPRLADPSVEAKPLIDFSSGYIQRAIDQFPKQGTKTPWRLYQNYVLDWFSLKLGSVRDSAMVFSKAGALPPR